MAKTVQIRNVPDKLHRTLKSRASAAGMTISEYALQTLKKELERPKEESIWERVQKLSPVKSNETAAEMVRAGREERDQYWDEFFSRR